MTVVGGRAHLLEEPLEAAGRHAEHAGLLLDLVGVRQPGRDEAEVAGGQQPRRLRPFAVLDVDAHLALHHVEGLVGVLMGVCRDEPALRRVHREDPELAVGLVAAEQHGEQVGEQHRVLALAAPEEERLGGARQDSLPPRAALGVGQIFEAHRVSNSAWADWPMMRHPGRRSPGACH
nr:hypothetical protein [Microbispora sp. NBRC 16548]